MKYTEESACFSCAGNTLLGILTQPETPTERGVIVVVGGPQYRAGSHRQFVHLSRALASAGYAVLRFDYQGMGDSEGDARDFQAVSADIAAAMDALQKYVPRVKQIALWGLCDGASAALLYCHETRDARVSTLCLMNPWLRSETSLARTQLKHYYVQRLLQKSFWTKLIQGGVAGSALTGLMRQLQGVFTRTRRAASAATAPDQSTVAARPFQQRMAAAWNDFRGPILLLLSGDDFTAKEFLEYARQDPGWKKALKHPQLTRHDLAGVDHTFSSTAARTWVTKLTLLGLADVPAAPPH